MTLKLVLKKKWYDMIASGEKKEEYREYKAYWISRLCAQDKHGDKCLPGSAIGERNPLCELCIGTFHNFVPKDYDKITFYLGYAKDRPSMTFNVKSVTLGSGKEKWGAEPGKEYFVFRLGEREA